MTFYWSNRKGKPGSPVVVVHKVWPFRAQRRMEKKMGASGQANRKYINTSF